MFNNFCRNFIVLFYLINFLSTTCSSSSSSSEFLIIRHGRSRVRHSTEKDHMRWGLKALDNLTFIEDSFDLMDSTENETAAGELNIVNFFENNASDVSVQFNQSNEFAPYEIDYANGNLHNVTNKSLKKVRLDNLYSTVSPLYFTPQPFMTGWIGKHGGKSVRKKEIMANIEKTVNKGIEYLKSHKNLDEIKIDIKDLFRIQTKKLVKNDGTTITSTTTTTTSTMPTTTTKSYKLDLLHSSEEFMQNDQPSEAHEMHEMESSTVTPTKLISLKNLPNQQSQKSNNQIRVSSKIIEITRNITHSNPSNLYKNDNDSYDDVQERQEDDTVNSHEVNGINSNENFINTINDDEGNELEDMMEDNIHLTGIYQVEDLDLSDLDETSKNNRKNLMRGRDVVTQFLQIVESQHVLGGNCTAGTALNLGEGVVDRYAQDRFRIEAEVAVNRANMLTRIFKLTPVEVQTNLNLLHASVLSMVEFDDDIFAAGHCFDWNQFPTRQGLFCPFAHRLPAPEVATLAKNLANEYDYLGNTSEFFFLARKNAEKVIARNEQYIKAYHSYTNDSERIATEILSVKYEDGRWSKPYYDCGGGNIWMLTYTVPFFGFENGTYFFKGTSGIDIDLRRVDIDQCPQKNTGTSGTPQPLNIFAGTDKCKQRTTECLPIPGLGFRRGSYKCVCRKGFYYPDTKNEFKYFNGSILEEEYAKLMQGEMSAYSEPRSFECLPCAEGCDSCEDSSPCVAELNWTMRTSILILACAVIGFLPPAAVFTHRYQQVKVVKAASPALLRIIVMGAFLIYCTSIVMYPDPSLYTCTAKIWLREIGFSLTYGALMLKTWRISVIFRVRSAKAVKITDGSLIKKLGLLCCFVGVALLVRTLVAPPIVIVGRTADNLKAFLCKTDWWDHTFTSMEVLFLAWGVRLCIVVRKAPSEFNESRFISMAIYNEFLLTCFLNVSMLFLQSPANPDLLYIILFCHTQLTVTLLLALIFGSKVYLVFRSGKALEDNLHNKTSGAKFISRTQIRTFASASSVNASTGPLQHTDNRLSENDAVEEIKQFAQQLQRLHERIPRGQIANIILTLLDTCKSVQSTNQLTLKPPTQALPLPIKKLSICDSSCVDKETNTSLENFLLWQEEQTNGCKYNISDKCDNNQITNNNNNKITSRSNRCCRNNAEQITCSTNSINFDNLQLQCMCSSDNNSIDEYQNEHCDNCSSSSHNLTNITSNNDNNSKPQSGSFRDKLISCTTSVQKSRHIVTDYVPTHQANSNLMKRNSELVLGTNFEVNPHSRYVVPKNYESCDNLYVNKQSLSDSMNKNKLNSNYSLKGEPSESNNQKFYLKRDYSLDRPVMKLSQSEDNNLKELKIALSNTLPAANGQNTCSTLYQQQQQQQRYRLINNAKQIQESQSITSSTPSCKIDKSQSLSASSTTDALAKQPLKQQSINDNELDKLNKPDGVQQQQQQIKQSSPLNKDIEKTTIGDSITTSSNNEITKNNVTSLSANNNNIKSQQNINNNNATHAGNSSTNANGKKRKSPDGKLTLDLNDRSKYGEEVSV